MNHELRIMNYGLLRLTKRRDSLIHYSLFIILAATLLVAAPAQAGSCSRFNSEGTCYLECRTVTSANECSGLTWAPEDCGTLIPRCQSGTFLGPLVGTPGTSCYKIQNQTEQLECRKALCADGYTCNFGVCIFGKDNASQGEVAQAADAGALPCNYTLDDIVQTGVNFANILFGITGSLMLVFILYGGYQLFISMGNAEEIQKAKQTLTMAFIGFIIVLGATAFVRFAGDLIGARFKETPGGGLGETVIPPPP